MAQSPSHEDAFVIEPVRWAKDQADVTFLFTEYAKWLDLDLSFQDFAAELVELPGKYTTPTGQLLLARSKSSGRAQGCVAIRLLPSASSGFCEMKRLYVLPAAQGRGIGKALAEAAIREASVLGYQRIRLDTLQGKMGSAITVYRKLGFMPCEQYYETPLDDTVFLELDLARGS